ncbi:MAG TPA: TonB-dependent receptor [Gemmatimonadaceae bacterium]|nr:TonB-dependent receptor [Gemmatimonadaceae bacterium]
MLKSYKARSLRGCVLILALAGIPRFQPAWAQGLTGASIDGTVVTPAGDPVDSAIVTLTELKTGAVRRTASAKRGAYLFESVAVGSYRLDATATGLGHDSLIPVTLHLGEHVRVKLVLGARHVHQLQTVTVGPTAVRDPGSGGPGQLVSRESIRNLPLLRRDFIGLFAISPQAVGPGGLWISGQHSRFNAIQIDGAIGNDLFGVALTQGAAAGARAVSLEALDEIRILVAPFDVRQGGFSGGLINAVTRSGSNIFHGSAFTSYSGGELVGADTAGLSVPAFDQLQYGVSIGGPIVRNRLHFLVVGEAQAQTTRFTGPSVEDIATGISEETAERAARAFRERYAFDAGGPESPDLKQPSGNLFMKLSWHPGSRHSIDVTQSLSRGSSDALNRVNRNQPTVDGWQLSNSGTLIRAITASTRINLLSSIGSLTNEAIIAASTVRDRRDSRNAVPLFIVRADRTDTYLAGGSVKGAQGTKTSERMFELTDNVSWIQGAHKLTLGTQNVILRIVDNFFLGSWGVWSFNSVDALEKADPSLYEVALPGPQGGPLTEYSASLLSVYVQDHWSPHRKLTITAGLRADAPVSNAPRRNEALRGNANLDRIDTGDFPSGNAVVAPRIGLTLALGTEARSMLRGGVGSFTGRPPLAWLSNAFSNTGQEQTILLCRRADGVPSVTTDITRLPSRCRNAEAPPSIPSVNYFASAFRFQQAVKYALGFDHQFSGTLSGSVDFIHTRSLDNVYVNDVNLVERGVDAEGRTMYGSITADGGVRPTRRDSVAFGPVYQYANTSSGRSTSVSVSAQQRLRSGGVLLAGYDWSRTVDVMSMTGFISSVIFRNNPVDGTLARRSLRTSGRDIPHSFVASALVPLPWGLMTSGSLRIRSGTPYAFTVNADANADGTRGNDLAYIPADSSDISLSNPAVYPALEAFILSQPCLRRQRGRIMTRNTCRNPAVTTLEGRVAKKIPVGNARAVEIGADLFNIPNMVSRRWGLVRETANREDLPLLALVGWDNVNNRPRYTIPVSAGGQPSLPSVAKVLPDVSRWRVQVGARYDF